MKKESATATIKSIDRTKRDLTLEDEQGQELNVHVPESVTRFDALKPGDRIHVDYYESVALSLKKGAAGAQPGASRTTTVQREAGTLPGGIAVRSFQATAQVMSVDRAKNQVTIKDPEGRVRTLDVTNPTMQAGLADLAAGDRIQVTYTEAIVISVSPQATRQPGATEQGTPHKGAPEPGEQEQE